MEELQSLLGVPIFGNTLQDYLVAVIVLLGVILFLKLLRNVLIGRLERLSRQTTTDVDDFVVELLKRHVGPWVYFLTALYLSSRSLILPESVGQILHVIFVVILTIKVVQISQELVVYFPRKWLAKDTSPTAASMRRNLSLLGRVILWSGGSLLVLDNIGIDVTALVAGMGIGGVAVALAAQTILGDAFSSFAIFVDKPFEAGDFIILGDFMGTVEQIGIKTTRVRSLGGEQVIFSNSDLTSSRIRNFKRMQERRVEFKIGITYQTTLEQLKAVPGMIRAIIQGQSLTRFDRAHFSSYGDFALIFEIVYYVLSPDYNVYMDIQQAINLKIKEVFEVTHIEFAYPAQQIYLTKTLSK